MLKARGLRYVRDGQEILANIDVTVEPGETLAVTGPSGSGKTTLLALLSGLAAPTAGEVYIEGKPVTRFARPADGVSVVLQGYGLVSLLTATENIEIALGAAGWPAADATSAARSTLAHLGLEAHADQLVEELSGGQQQRTAVARALALRPRLLIADEPTAELDPAARAVALAAMFDIAAGGGSLVLATHDPEVADRCDRIIDLRPGQAQAREPQPQRAQHRPAQHRPAQHRPAQHRPAQQPRTEPTPALPELTAAPEPDWFTPAHPLTKSRAGAVPGSPAPAPGPPEPTARPAPGWPAPASALPETPGGSVPVAVPEPAAAAVPVRYRPAAAAGLGWPSRPGLPPLHQRGAMLRDYLVEARRRAESGGPRELAGFADFGLRLLELHQRVDLPASPGDPLAIVPRCLSCMLRWPCPTFLTLAEILDRGPGRAES